MKIERLSTDRISSTHLFSYLPILFLISLISFMIKKEKKFIDKMEEFFLRSTSKLDPLILLYFTILLISHNP